jgi:hypothetical protein
MEVAMHVVATTSMPSNAVANQDHKQSPAKAARDLLQSRADLAGEPFGKLVSLFARGQDIPSAPTDPNSAGATDPSANDTANSNTGST